MTEDELTLLFETIEAIIDAKDRASGVEEFITATDLKQDCIKMIAKEGV